MGEPRGESAAVPPAGPGELLGLSPGARVLIVNGDDFGIYQAVNAGVIESIEQGIASSCSLMVPCPRARHAMALLQQKPDIPFGIHLTLVCEMTRHRWGPVTAKERVTSLLDEAGELFTPTRFPGCSAKPASARWSWSSAPRSTP